MASIDESLACLVGITFPGAIVSWDGVTGNIHVQALNVDVAFKAADNPQLDLEVVHRYGDVTFVLHSPVDGEYEAREIAPANPPGQYGGTITDTSGRLGKIRCEELRQTVQCDLSSLPKAFVGQKVTFDIDESSAQTMGTKPALDGPMLTRPRVDNRKMGKIVSLCDDTRTGILIPGNLKFKVDECPELVDPEVGSFVVFTALGRLAACEVRFAEGEEIATAEEQESSWHAETEERTRRSREEAPVHREVQLSSPLHDALPWAAKRALEGSHDAKRRKCHAFRGKIKSYNADKCWGFITCKALGDVFYSLRLNPHLQLLGDLAPHTVVDFDLSAEDTGKKAAINIREVINEEEEEDEQKEERWRLIPLSCLGKIVDINPGEFAQIRVEGKDQKLLTLDFMRNPNLRDAPLHIGQYVEFDIDDRGRPREARTEILGVIHHPPRRGDWGFLRTKNLVYVEDIFFSLTRNPALQGVPLEDRKVWFRLMTERSGKLAAVDAEFLEPAFEGTIAATANGLMVHAPTFPEGLMVDLHLSPDLSDAQPLAEGDEVLFNLSEEDARCASDVVRKTNVSQRHRKVWKKSFEHDSNKEYTGEIDKVYDDFGFISLDGYDKRIFFNFDKNPNICPPEVGQAVRFRVDREGSGKLFAHDAQLSPDSIRDELCRNSPSKDGKEDDDWRCKSKVGKEEGDYRNGKGKGKGKDKDKSKGKGGKNRDDRWSRGNGWKDDDDHWDDSRDWKDGEDWWGKRRDWRDDKDHWGKRTGWKDDEGRWGRSRDWKDDEGRWGSRRDWKDDEGRWGSRRDWKDDEDRWGKSKDWKDGENWHSRGGRWRDEEDRRSRGKGGKSDCWKSFSEGATYALRTAGKSVAEMDNIIEELWTKEVERLGKTHSW